MLLKIKCGVLNQICWGGITDRKWRMKRNKLHNWEVGLDFQMNFSSFDCSISFQINRFSLIPSFSLFHFFFSFCSFVLFTAGFCRIVFYEHRIAMMIHLVFVSREWLQMKSNEPFHSTLQKIMDACWNDTGFNSICYADTEMPCNYLMAIVRLCHFVHSNSCSHSHVYNWNVRIYYILI